MNMVIGTGARIVNAAYVAKYAPSISRQSPAGSIPAIVVSVRAIMQDDAKEFCMQASTVM